MFNILGKAKLYYSIVFVFLVIISFLLFFRIVTVNGSCAFLSNWPFCSGLVDKNHLKLALSIFCLSVISLFFGFFAFFSNKYFLKYNAGVDKKKIYRPVFFLLGCAFLSIPFVSSDSVYYFNVGKAIFSGVNPYISSWEINNNFSYLVQGSTTGLMYGPLVAILIFLVFGISFNNYWVFIFLWKLLMLLTLFLVGFYTKKIYSILNQEDRENIFWFYWLTSPFILFEWVVNGHFDGLWLIFVLLAVLFSLKNKWFAVLPILFVGIWIKFIPIFMLPWFLIWWYQEVNISNRLKMVWQVSVGFLLSLFITFVSWFYFWEGFSVFKPILLQSKWAVNSLFSVIYYSLKPLFVGLFSDNAHYILTRMVHLFLFFVMIYFFWPFFKKIFRILFFREKMSGDGYLRAIFITMLLYLVIWQKSFWPWYFAWLIPFGILIIRSASSDWSKKILVWISSVPFIFYIPQFLIVPGESALWFSYYVFFALNAMLIFFLYKWRKTGYDII